LEAAVNNLPRRIRVLIADDHRMFAEALETILGTGDLEPVRDGLQATKQIRKQWPTACVLMLTGSNAKTDVDRAREAGAAGYVTKERIAAELIDAILEIASR